jgi:predicted CoA-binding protein
MMAHANPSSQELKQLLSDATVIAMVGASSDPDKASNGIMRKLQHAGYRVIPVNPTETEILGERSYPSLLDVPERVDIAKALWLQTGIVNEDAAERAKKGGLTVVMDACIGATHSLLRVPRKAAHA